MSKNSNSESTEEKVYVLPKIPSSLISTILKPVLGFFAFICVGYYTLWLSSNYVKKETFDNYTTKQDQILSSRFDTIQNKLEVILNQQIITTEQFKNLNLILNTQQKSLENISERVTFLERNYFKPNQQVSKQ
jgi:hypothetical protein